MMSKKIQLNNFLRKFPETKEYKNFILDFLNLSNRTKKLFPEMILITSITNQKNNFNLAIDTSNSYDTNNIVKLTYKKILLNFIKIYISKEIYQEVLKFSLYSSNLVNISFNITSEWLNFNISYTAQYLNTSTTNYIMKNYISNFWNKYNDNFVSINFSASNIIWLKHYWIVFDYKFAFNKYNIIPIFFSKITDSYMLLSRYNKDSISHKLYYNIYNSWYICSNKFYNLCTKLGIPENKNSLFIWSRIWSLASEWNKHFEVYYVLDI